MFLRAHQIEHRTFSIGGRLTPVAIRDQMIRGWTFVEHGLEDGLLYSDPSAPLLVVGAGAGGATAAIRAAQRGVPVLLIDRALQPFSTQFNCDSRWICPTQYDWPVAHWDRGEFPTRPPGMPGSAAPFPLVWKADWAHNLAAQWRAALLLAEASYAPLLRLESPLELVEPCPLTTPPNGVEVRLRDPTTGHYSSRTVQALLLAFGFGEERVYLHPLHSARGIRFWDRDPFGRPDLGVGGKPRVLISGGGDGALIDFLRTVTNDLSVGIIYQRCIVQCLSHDAQTQLEARIFNAQDWGARAYAWGRRQTDHELLSYLQLEHEQAVDAVLADAGAAIEAAVRRLLRNPLPEVRLCYGCTHFGQCYPLNRFLALLVERCLRRVVPDPVLWPETRVTEIRGLGRHACNQSADDCHGQLHEVAISAYPGPCSGPQAPAGVHDPAYLANVLILRHGPQLTTEQERLSPPIQRQMPPYAL